MHKGQRCQEEMLNGSDWDRAWQSQKRNEIGRAKDEVVNLRRHSEKEIEKLILGTLSVEDL